MASSIKRLDFVVDGATMDMIDQLARDLAAPSTEAVFRKALAIARVAAEQGRGSDGQVILRGGSRPEGVCLLLQS